MEVRTQEIIRYIDLRFREQDLKELIEELDIIDNYFKTNNYQAEKKMYERMKKLKEFHKVITDALSQIRS